MSGVDLVFHQVAVGPMANFNYLVGSRSAGQAALIDPAWEIEGLLELAAHEGLKVAEVWLTHTHTDHIGGMLWGQFIPGLAELLAVNPCPVYVHPAEAEAVEPLAKQAGVDCRPLADGQLLKLGRVEARVLHTPGHSPGGVCFLVEGRVMTGDTLFVGACGRTDLAGGDPAQLWHSLSRVLAALPGQTLVYPGHDYQPPYGHSTIGQELERNPYMAFPSAQAFIQAMGG